MESAARFQAILDDTLPPLPDRVPYGGQVPVAVWMGVNFGAVTVIEDSCPKPDDPHHRRYLAITYAYKFGEHGWELPQVLAGTEWPGGSSTWANLEERDVFLEAGWSGSPGGWRCRKVEGFAGAAAMWLELSEGLSTTMHAIAPSGAFIAVVDGGGPAKVHILDRAGEPIRTYHFADASDPPTSLA